MPGAATSGAAGSLKQDEAGSRPPNAAGWRKPDAVGWQKLGAVGSWYSDAGRRPLHVVVVPLKPAGSADWYALRREAPHVPEDRTDVHSPYSSLRQPAGRY